MTKTKSRVGSKMSKSALRDTNENKILVESRNQSNRFKPDQPKNRRQSLRLVERSRSRARSKNSSIDFDKNLEPDFASPIKISKPSRVDRRQTCANMNRSQIFCQSILGGLKTKSSFLETTQNRRRISTAFFTKAIQEKIKSEDSIIFEATEDRQWALKKLNQQKPITINQFMTM